jgi:hypothetical protein
MRKATRIVLALAIVAVWTTATPAQAANVIVRFGLSAGHYAPGACLLSVPQGANGLGVLDAAIAAGCILDYEMDGEWLQCVTVAVEPVCSNVDDDPLCCATHYWAIYEDLGAVAPHGLSGFSAGNTTHMRLMGQVGVEHEELVLSYESWAKCLAWPALCNPDL